MKPAELLKAERFPRSSRYNPEWILAGVGGGTNPLWLTEWLTKAMELRPGMRVLDLGCGRAMSSIFLHREFFDAIISIDSFFYYGTDDLYLGNIARFVKPGGPIAIAGAGLMREFHDAVPEHLRAWWIPETPDVNCLHSALWWKHHWSRSGLLDVSIADTMPDGWKYWLDWHKAVAPGNALEIQALEADRGECLGYVRAIGHRRAGIKIAEPTVSLPERYEQKPLLRATD